MDATYAAVVALGAVIGHAGFPAAYGTAGTRQSANISSWLGDVRASFQLGPLLLSGMTMFTRGNDAKSNPYKSIHYYQPLDTDTSYMADWGTQIMSLGIDYYQILNGGAAGAGRARRRRTGSAACTSGRGS